MNVDLLADNPSFTCYFVVAIPFMTLLLVPMLVVQHSAKIRSKIVSFADRARGHLMKLRKGSGGKG